LGKAPLGGQSAFLVAKARHLGKKPYLVFKGLVGVGSSD